MGLSGLVEFMLTPRRVGSRVASCQLLSTKTIDRTLRLTTHGTKQMSDLSGLSAPFEHDDIGWVPVYGHPKNEKIKEWVIVAPFVDARAIQDRLDAVVGPDAWRVSYSEAPAGGVMCCLEILTQNGWVAKHDAAENTQVEAVKGGLSSAFKRAATVWGIGRYLYSVGTKRVNCDKRGNWDPPHLPSKAGKTDPTARAEKPTPTPPTHTAVAGSPGAQITKRITDLGFSDDQLSAFFEAVEALEECAFDELRASRQLVWATKLDETEDDACRNKILKMIDNQ